MEKFTQKIQPSQHVTENGTKTSERRKDTFPRPPELLHIIQGESFDQLHPFLLVKLLTRGVQSRLKNMIIMAGTWQWAQNLLTNAGPYVVWVTTNHKLTTSSF